MKNWKTTLIGVLLGAVQALPNSPYKPILTNILTAVGLFFAADSTPKKEG